MKKKICFIAPLDQPYSTNWVNYYSEKGWEVNVISDKLPRTNIEVDPRVKVFYVNLDIPKLHPIYSNLMTYYYIKKINPDIIHGHTVGRSITSYFLSNKPFVISVWGPSHIDKRSMRAHIINKITYNSSTSIIVSTESIKSRIVDKFKLNHGKFFQAPWGIDLNLFYKGYERESLNLRAKLGIPVKSPVVICTRTFSRFYGLDLIASSLSEIFSRRADVHFIFLKCETKLFNKLKLEMTTSNFKQNIHIVKEILPHSEIPIYLNASDVSLHMTKSENGAGSLLESLACGNLVIATDHADYQERIKEQNLKAFLIERDVNSITNQIISCLDNLEQKDLYYKHNKKLIESNESQEATFNRVEKLYKYLILKEERSNEI